MQLLAVPEGEYIVFEHGPFDYEQENRSVEEKIEKAMADFDYAATSFCLDTAPAASCIFTMTRPGTSNIFAP